MRALIPHEGSAPVRDRLLITLFIAALLHGILIMGLTFAGDGPDGSGPRGLDVLLVSDQLPSAASNDTATYLAQRTQIGSGNASGPAVLRNQAPDATPPTPETAQGNASGSTTSSAPAAAQADDPVLATTATRTDIRYFATSEGPGAAPTEPLAAAPTAVPSPAGDVGPVQLRGVQRDELWITPDTRESIIAPYLDAWRARVERVGTLNYPTAARRAAVQASPVLEVAIDADGRLAKAEIMTSSGFPDLDAAALAILKLASPFDPFPPDLAARYHTLRFAYEWQFTGGRVTQGAVAAVP